jgi:hypothetical protein
MSEGEVERLFRAIEALRVEVQSYRENQNERLTKLSEKVTTLETLEKERTMSRKQIYTLVGIATGVVSATTVIVTSIIDRL